MNNAVCFGRGYVGKATMLAFGIEKFYTRHEANITLEEAAQYKYIFLTLPTPNINGVCFTDDIAALIGKLSILPGGKDALYINRSTVSVGTAADLSYRFGIQVVSNPEFS